MRLEIDLDQLVDELATLVAQRRLARSPAAVGRRGVVDQGAVGGAALCPRLRRPQRVARRKPRRRFDVA